MTSDHNEYDKLSIVGTGELLLNHSNPVFTFLWPPGLFFVGKCYEERHVAAV
jgi:methionine transaminase